jgi:hypothetical protein
MKYVSKDKLPNAKPTGERVAVVKKDRVADAMEAILRVLPDIASKIAAAAPPVVNVSAPSVVVEPAAIPPAPPAPNVQVAPEIKISTPETRPTSWVFEIKRGSNGLIKTIVATPGEAAPDGMKYETM